MTGCYDPGSVIINIFCNLSTLRGEKKREEDKCKLVQLNLNSMSGSIGIILINHEDNFCYKTFLYLLMMSVLQSSDFVCFYLVC